jgi:methanogenic corrinoid protein MtbC1
MFLPEGEYHELGLLFYYYLVKKSGKLIYYLGSSVPYIDVIETAKMVKTDYLFTSITSSITGIKTTDYLNKLSKEFPFQTIFITGLQVKEGIHNVPANIRKISSPLDLNEFLKIN